MNLDDLNIYIWDFEKNTEEKDKKKTLDELIMEYQSENNPKGDEKIDFDRLIELKTAIGNKLGLIPQEQLTDWIEGILENIVNVFNELKNELKNHRHKLTENFSSKAEL